MSYRVASILTVLALTQNGARIAASLGLLLAALGFGFGLVTFLQFPPGWSAIAAVPVVVLIGGAVSASFTNARINESYKTGAEARVMIANGTFLVKLNGHTPGGAVSSIVRVRHFGQLSAIEFAGKRYVVVPTRVVPGADAHG